AFSRYHASMDVYEKGILAFAMPALIALGWFWKPLRWLSVAAGAATLAAIALYAQHTDSFGADLAAGEKVFWLKYLLSSQGALLWMSLLFYMSTLFYWGGMLAGAGRNSVAEVVGSKLAWGGVFMALTGRLVRWFESHQIGPDIGHIPVSNLYEVFVLFCWLTTLFYLYYEQRYRTRALGAFVMLVVSAAVGFLLWYTLGRDAQEIQPLLPALPRWWMKLHVPANFIGYGTFSLAAMVSLAYLLKTASPRALWTGLVGAPLVLGVLPVSALLLLSAPGPETAAAYAKSLTMLGTLIGILALTVVARGALNARTPAAVVMDDLMYKAIAVGFAFF